MVLKLKAFFKAFKHEFIISLTGLCMKGLESGYFPKIFMLITPGAGTQYKQLK